MVFSIAAVVLVVGAAAAWHYAMLGLALSHWDARAHMVVARRIFDSLTPGWQQIGGVWLPFPHVLNSIPVQVDAWYRSGASGTAISVISMSAGAAALASMLLRSTGSISAATAGAVLLTTHDLETIEPVINRAVMLQGGRLMTIAAGSGSLRERYRQLSATRA